MISELNVRQASAVTAIETNMLVIAGAGSGKTRVLVERMAFLIREKKISAFDLLAVTFTNKAAREMRSRLEYQIDQPLRQMWVGTFHGLAHRFLRIHWREAGLIEQFVILDSDDQLRLVKKLIASQNLDDTRFKPRSVAGFFNDCKDKAKRSIHLETDLGKNYHNDTLISLYQGYEEICKTQNLVDFGELLLLTFETLRNSETLLAKYHERFRHLLIDEFQDTNEIQYLWIRLLSNTKNFVMAVGDDDQSIYSWRGARIENIQRFTKDFKDVFEVRLEQNYRSTETILKAANSLISNNTGRLGKNLWTDCGERGPIELYTAFNEQDEARFVSASAKRLNEQNRNYKEMAVLYRSNSQSRVLEEALLREKIPYRIYGGQRFYERLEIKNALMYLRLISNKQDDTAFERVVNMPPRGIGDKTMGLLRETARDEGLSLWDSVSFLLNYGCLLSSRATSALASFKKMLECLSDLSLKLPLSDLTSRVIVETKLIEYHRAEKGERGQTRVENLEELISAIDSYVPEDDNTPALIQFLNQASLDAGERQADIDDDAVQLMTLHSAKGLEFPEVFLVGVEEDLFPHKMSLDSVSGIEEERRLAYVGMTRAMKKLTLTHAERRKIFGEEKVCRLSRFVKQEIPSDLIQEIRIESSNVRSQGSIKYGAQPIKWAQLNKEKEAIEQQLDAIVETLYIGQRVEHKVFGEGTILEFKGTGAKQKASILFDDEGIKVLFLIYAKLIPLG